jgi:hypothetical protein
MKPDVEIGTEEVTTEQNKVLGAKTKRPGPAHGNLKTGQFGFPNRTI